MIQNYLNFAVECLYNHSPHELAGVTEEKVKELLRDSKINFGTIDFDRFQQIMRVYLDITNHISDRTSDFNILYPHLKHPYTGEAHFITKAEGWVNIQPMYLYKMMDFENRGIFVQWLEKLVDKT